MNGSLRVIGRNWSFEKVQMLLFLEMTQRVKLAAFILSQQALWHKKASESEASATATSRRYHDDGIALHRTEHPTKLVQQSQLTPSGS